VAVGGLEGGVAVSIDMVVGTEERCPWAIAV